MHYLKKIIKEELQKILKEQQELPKFMSSGNLVVQLQTMLKELGYEKLLGKKGIDGIYGNNTKAAVKSFQQDNDISRNDGLVDEETMKKITKKFGELFLGGATAFSMMGAGTAAAATVTKKQPATQCQQINGTAEQKQKYNIISKQLISSGVPLRSACELAFIKIRPQYAGKPFFVVDTRDKIIYLYNKEGNYVAKSAIVSGKNAQSQNEAMIAEALKSTEEKMKSIGIEFKNGQHYKNGKKIDDETALWDYLHAIDATKTRFMPKGVYNIALAYKDKHEVGTETGDNMFRLKLGNKFIGPAIHGFFKDKKRYEWFENATKKYNMDSNNPAVKKQYLSHIRANVGKFAGGYGSYGCVNVSLDFLTKMRPYAMGATVFVLGEQEENYLVQNSSNFFEGSEQAQNLEQYASAYPAKIEINVPQQQQPGKEERAYA